jgi:hypothetical protein
MGLRSTMALLMALLGAAPGGAGALKLRVMSRQRECVQEVASEVGEVITGSFIADGGEATAKAQASNLFMPKHRFDLVVMDPNLNTVYTIRKKTDHRFEIPVKVAGSYTFCFNNQARTQSTRSGCRLRTRYVIEGVQRVSSSNTRPPYPDPVCNPIVMRRGSGASPRLSLGRIPSL